MKGCKHSPVGYYCNGVVCHPLLQPHYRRCSRCGETLPLGPANDASEAVKLEIRAAEIAATADCIGCDDVEDILECEQCGIDDHEIGADPQSPAQWAGWLAREISHEAESGER